MLPFINTVSKFYIDNLREFAIIFFITTLIACNKKDSVLQFSKSISFELPFYPNHAQSGFVFNKKSDSTEFYFANISESDLLIFFDINGKPIDTLNLSALRKELGYVIKGAVIHGKQYLGIDENGESIILDSLGHITKRFKVNDFFQALTDSIYYNYYYAETIAKTHSSKILIHPMWYATEKLPYNDSIVKIAQVDYKRYLKIAKIYTKKTPLAFQINLDKSNHISANTVYNHYNSQIVKENEFIYGYFEPAYGFAEDGLLALNKFHDSLWVIDENSVVSSFHISLKLTSNRNFLKYASIIDLDDSTLNYDMSYYLDSIENRMLKNSYFESINYHKWEKIYFLVLRAPLDPEKGDDLTLDFGFEKKNIVMLDSNFNVLHETILEKGKYRPLSYLIKEGFLISTDNPNLGDYNPKVYTFDLYKINQ